MQVDRIWKVGGERPLNPSHIAEQATTSGWPVNWLGRANGLTVPRGFKHGEAHFLLSHDSLNKLDLESQVDIECQHENGTTTWPGWYVVRSQAVSKDKDKPPHWVTLADRRYILNRVAANRRYNLRKSTGYSSTAYVSSTINGGSPFTWQEVLDDLWGLLPAGIAGAAPSLSSYSIATTPENLDFTGMSAWRAINHVLTAIGYAVAYDAEAEEFSYVDLSATQSGLATLKSDNEANRLWDFRPEELVKNQYPAQVEVAFHWIPGNGESPWLEDPALETATVNGGGFGGVKWPVADTMFAWDDNSSDRTARAAEIGGAIAGLLKPLASPWGAVYMGVLAFKCGEEITEVSWTSDGERGTRTTAKFSECDIDWPKLGPIFGGTGTGGGDSIRFRIVDVVCYGDAMQYVEAEVTHYTGGCDVDPPDMDPYTGYVYIYDTCVLSYYTVDFLLSGTDGDGATGRATYFYPRDGYCEGQWLIDSICGSPECND